MIMKQSDIQYFRNVLEKMLEEIQEKGQSTIDDMSGSAQVYADPADRASQESDQFFTLRLRDRDRKLISKVNAALERIEDGTYGVCEECGEEISIPRLKARPVTTLCIHCKSQQEEDERLGQK
jgi:DnaK suppressor protein